MFRISCRRERDARSIRPGEGSGAWIVESSSTMTPDFGNTGAFTIILVIVELDSTIHARTTANSDGKVET